MKIDVLSKMAKSYPVNHVQIIGEDGDIYDFWLQKQDAFQESQRIEHHRRLCDEYLGEPERLNRATGEVLSRKPPTNILKPIPMEGGGEKVITPSTDLFWIVSGIVVMQDWKGHEFECYEPEELIALGGTDKKAWDELKERSGAINEEPRGKDLAADTDIKSELSSST